MISEGATYGIIYACSVVGILFGIMNYMRVRAVDLKAGSGSSIDTPLAHGTEDLEADRKKIDLMLTIGEYISRVCFNLFH